jgi:uncharacterized membrane protein YhaH (DUF805 family)
MGDEMAAVSRGRAVEFLRGRSGRREYWLSLVGLVAFNIILHVILRDPVLVSLISLPFWVILSARRLHDLNRTGWWSLVPFGVGFLVGFAGGIGIALPGIAAPLLQATVTLAMVAVLGFSPGNPASNRFGEPAKAPLAA